MKRRKSQRAEIAALRQELAKVALAGTIEQAKQIAADAISGESPAKQPINDEAIRQEVSDALSALVLLIETRFGHSNELYAAYGAMLAEEVLAHFTSANQAALTVVDAAFASTITEHARERKGAADLAIGSDAVQALPSLLEGIVLGLCAFRGVSERAARLAVLSVLRSIVAHETHVLDMPLVETLGNILVEYDLYEERPQRPAPVEVRSLTLFGSVVRSGSS